MRFAINKLTLTNFRNYVRMRLDITNKSIILLGSNGVGKTNILEALSLLIPGRGMRQTRLSTLIREGSSEGWAISADVVTPSGKLNIGTGYALASITESRDRRIVKINGVQQSNQNCLANHMGVIWLTPQMDRLFNDPPSARRKFLDKLIGAWDPLHSGRINAYNIKMRERLLILGSGTKIDLAWVSALESIMVEKGVAISAARVEFLSRLAPIASLGIDLFPGADMKLDGDLEFLIQSKPALEVEDWFRETLKINRSSDVLRGRTLIGPHTTDLIVRHNIKKQMASLCSTGEQKSLLISIILANAKCQSMLSGTMPLLLLDEVTAHLDQEKRDVLFSHLEYLDIQTWFTGTDKYSFGRFSKKSQVICVKNGNITNL